MNHEQDLIESLCRIECKYAGLLTADLAQSEQARARIRARCQESRTATDVAEFRFTLPDPWSRLLFHALLKRYGLKGYRYQGQRQSSCMLLASKRLIDELLSPLFDEMCQRLNACFLELTQKTLPAAISPAPYQIDVLPNHAHDRGKLCPECRKRLGL
jgi:hypothetical protein